MTQTNDPRVSQACVALVSITNDQFREEWRWLYIDRIQRDRSRYVARLMPDQGVPNVTPGSTELWGRLTKSDNPHLRMPTLEDKETVEVSIGDMKCPPRGRPA